MLDDKRTCYISNLSKKCPANGETDLDICIEDISDSSEKHKLNPPNNGCGEKSRNGTSTLIDFIKVEMTRGYILEHDEERYSARRQKIYSFMKIPREVEKFMGYGVIQCTDSFLYIHTFLPIRFVLAIWAVISRSISRCFGFQRGPQRLLTPAEMCDLLKSAIWMICTLLMLSVDTNRVYHIIKSQSIIKLYIFYNMLEVGDRLLSAFGQDTIDALFWTATEPKKRKREHFGLIPHILFALMYVVLHSFLIMFQATALNVAVNSNNKGLLTIMISNNFVELKGSVFKKFDKNNLFQLTCSDVRERFHLSVLLFIVVIQTMKEFNWSSTQFYVMLPDCFYVLITEILIDWIKHAFITRFNELAVEVYREYTLSLAYDMTQTRQKHAFSDHSDLVARRMGFIPFPLGVVLIKALYSAVSLKNFAAFLIFFIAYITLMGCRVLNTICGLGKACELMKQHQKKTNVSPSSSYNTPVQASTLTNSNATRDDVSLFSKYSSNFYKYLKSDISVKAISRNKLRSKHPNSPLANNSLDFGGTALFSNSDVDLDDVRLNEKVIKAAPLLITDELYDLEKELTRSVPNLQPGTIYLKNEFPEEHSKPKIFRSSSEPLMQVFIAKNNS